MLFLFSFLNAALAQVPVAAPVPGRDVGQERLGGTLGIGVGVGAPSGVTGKLWLGDWSGVQFNAGGDLGRPGDLVGTADYVIHLRPFNTETDEYSVPLHAGAGFNLTTNTFEGGGVVLLGPRAVFGLTVLARQLPVDLFVETAPTFYVYEALTWSIDGQVGVRYYL